MAGLERPSKLRRARIEGPAEQRCLLFGWRPIHPKALWGPAGAIAKLAPERPVERLVGGDFDLSEYRVAYLRLVGPDGRYLDAFSEGQKTIPEDWLNRVEFRREGDISGPDPEVGLEALFQNKLENPGRLHEKLTQLEASGLIRRDLEPFELDPLLRPIFWRYFDHRARSSQLAARLAGLDLGGVDLAEFADLMAIVRSQAFRDGTAIGAALASAELRDVLGPEIEGGRQLAQSRGRGADEANLTKRRKALAEERALYRVWKRHAAEISKRPPGERAGRLLLKITPEELLEAVKAEREVLDGYRQKLNVWAWPGEDRVTKMIRWWDRGHDPTRPSAPTWRELQERKAKL